MWVWIEAFTCERSYLAQPPWNKIADSTEGKGNEISEVCMQPLPGNQLGAIAVISLEPKEVTVVLINGVINTDDIGKLGGNMGIPDLHALMDLKKPK